jgi:hypothetical protein
MSPIKTITYKEGDGTARKALFLGDGGEEGVGEREQLLANMKGKGKADESVHPLPKSITTSQAMQVHVAEDGRGSSMDEVVKVQT